MINLIIKTLLEAGEIARNKQKNVSALPKIDNSPITEVDLEVSKLVRDRISSYTNLPNHMFIDEEFDREPKEHWAEYEKAEYSWLIDPIAGTMSYLNGLPFYAISVGVLKDKKPYCGGVYLPESKELYWHENSKAYYQKDNGEVVELTPQNQKMNRFSLFYINMHSRFSLPLNVCRTISVPSINFGLAKLAQGCVTGVCMKVWAWDVASVWGICQAVGIDFYTYPDGEKIEEFSNKYYDLNWKMKNPIIASNQENIKTFIDNLIVF